ncbi:MAG: RNA polymerase sigma factor [Saprospiraceae bacterium]|nr:RNA polymerase sigma factor [Saprospiraceae bacterium]
MQQIILTYRKELLRYSFNLTKDKDNAEDLLQDTFMRVLPRFDILSEVKNIKSYLMTTMRNIHIDNIRRQKRQKQYQNQLLNESFTADNDSESDMVCQDIKKHIQALKIEWREPLIMYYLGHSYDEMSASTGVSIPNLRLRLFYARRELRIRLSEFG